VSRRIPTTIGAVAIAALLAACGSGADAASPSSPSTPSTSSVSPSASMSMGGGATPSDPSMQATPDAPSDPSMLPGMPVPLSRTNLYAADAPNALSPAVAHDLYRVYVPNTGSDTVTVIDPTTYRVIGHFPVGHQPQHVVPSWDLRTLWVNNDLGNSLTPIDPRTGRPGHAVPVADPYNLYFTPDGRHAVVMASKLHRLDFRDPHTMAMQKSAPVPCAGVNHADWTVNGRYFLVSCEFSHQLLWVDTEREKVLKVLSLPGASMPQDVKISPDGSTVDVADMMSNGVWVYRVTAHGPVLERLMHTGAGAHGLYVSRDATEMFVSNRGEGSISVIDFATGKVRVTWRIPGGGSPDMGNLSPDGRTLWLSGRYNGVVYAIDTSTGALRAKIRVGTQPHGLTVWPQPGRYSLGHTGIMR
jgi:YVTN family beta-propeller protein